MSESYEGVFLDHYATLGVDIDSDRQSIRRAFRARLLEVHPDKSVAPTDGGGIGRVMRAWEILGDDDLREAYDRIWKLYNREDFRDEASKIPHVTESDRPQNQARSILFLLLEDRGPEALGRLRKHGELSPVFLRKHLDSDEFIDAAFLIAELFEAQKSWFVALEWLEHLLREERGRRRHRPCYNEALDRMKRLLIRRTVGELEPRAALEYLRRAETLGLDRSQKAETAKRRCQCYLDMGMRQEALRHLEIAKSLQPSSKGLARLREALQEKSECQDSIGAEENSNQRPPEADDPE